MNMKEQRKQIMKRICCVLMIFAMLLGTWQPMPVKAAKAVDLGGAIPITFGTILNGAITETEDAVVYSLSLSSAGRINLDMESHMKYYSIIIYDDAGEMVWYTDQNSWNDNLKYIRNNHTADLKSGSYFLRVTGYKYKDDMYASTGTFSLSIGFDSAGETMSEPNNEFSQASTLNVNGTIKGQIASNDREDIYTFSLSKSGKLNLTVTSYMQYYSIILFDNTGERIWYTDQNEWNSNLSYRTDEYDLYLSASSYYLRVTGYKYKDDMYSSTGNYTITTIFTESGENIAEPNNDFTTAYPVALNQSLTGEIAIDDAYDICRFSLPQSMDLGIAITSYMKYYSLEIDDADGKKIWEDTRNEWNENVGYRSDNLQVTLSAGTYYLKVYSEYGATGTYKLCLGKMPSVQEASVAKLKNYVYQSRYIEPLVKVTYGGKTLKKDVDYTLSYNNNYNIGQATVVITGIGKYTGTKEVHFMIVPKTPKIHTVKNSSVKTMYLEWDSIYGVDGYEIYYSTRKTSGYKLFYRSAKGYRYNALTTTALKKGKTYYFKVRAYKIVDGKRCYGNFSKYRVVKRRK